MLGALCVEALSMRGNISGGNHEMKKNITTKLSIMTFGEFVNNIDNIYFCTFNVGQTGFLQEIKIIIFLPYRSPFP